MASAKEIQNRIRSIQDTMKITRAMYMMSSMKLRKAKKKLEDTEPYFFGLQEQIGSILYHFPDTEHIFFDNRENDRREGVKRQAIIVITGDKGMAGAYNHNVLKAAEELCAQKESYRLFVVGELGRQYFMSRNYPVEESFRFTATNPSMHRARVITEMLVEMYKEDQFDEVYLVFTRMVNSMKEEVGIQRLLPLSTRYFLRKKYAQEGGPGQGKDTDFFIYPGPEYVLKKLVYNYFTGFLYGALVEATASEENARMMAMQSATDNAEAMLHDLSIEYNRVRQAAITQEITEVIGGAKALKKKKKKRKANEVRK